MGYEIETQFEARELRIEPRGETEPGGVCRNPQISPMWAFPMLFPTSSLPRLAPQIARQRVIHFIIP